MICNIILSTIFDESCRCVAAQKKLVLDRSDSFLRLDGDDEEIIRHQWERAVSCNSALYDGLLYNFRDFSETSVRLTMHVNKVRYSFYFVKQYADLRARIKNMINPLTAGSVTITSDNRIVMGRREEGLIAGRKLTPLSQGFIAYKEGTISPETTVIDRLKFELGIRRKEIKSIRPLGFVYDKIYGHTMLIYTTSVSLSSDEVLQRSTGAGGKHLASRVFFLKEGARELTEFLSSKSREMTGDCIGSFLLYGGDDLTKNFLQAADGGKG